MLYIFIFHFFPYARKLNDNEKLWIYGINEYTSGLIFNCYCSHQYLFLSRHREDGVEKCRRLFHQAVNSVSDDIQRVCEAYLQFEREEGSLESFEAALSRTEAQLGRIRERQEKVREGGREEEGREGGGEGGRERTWRVLRQD